MCGLTGVVSFIRSDNNSYNVISKMLGEMSHRGPDDSGVWCEDDLCVGLGHNRLSIQDLSPAGHQPMISRSGRYVIAYNGEIYNFKEIKGDLDASVDVPGWRGYSDTEVLLGAIERWGVELAIERSVGMFAFALWDRREKVLTLARDRIGEKPLYYGWQGNVFLFSSELKAMKAHPSWRGQIDRNALSAFMRYSYVPSPMSIYKGISKLQPGHLLKISMKDTSRPHVGEPIEYWSVRKVVEHGLKTPFKGSELDAVQRLDHLLKTSIKEKMISDVPLGVFLSGGIDSTIVAALMKEEASEAVRSFSIGFSESEYNEAIYSKQIASYLGTDHTELYLSASDAQNIIPRLPYAYDEPFADASQIPTLLVSKLAKNYVTVALTGDGGDEVFGGYNRYIWGQKIWSKIKHLPYYLRKNISTFILSISPKTWSKVYKLLETILPKSTLVQLPGDQLHKMAGILHARSQKELYYLITSKWKNPSHIVKHSSDPSLALICGDNSMPQMEFAHEMMMYDIHGYLPDDILTKVDRAAMSVSLETRVPILDHRIIEFSWGLPLNYKIRNGESKYLLKQLLYNYVPKEMMERPKIGFGIPIDRWLRFELRDWAEALLDENKMKQQGFLNPELIRKKWDEHLSGENNWQYYLWNALMFQTWLEAQ